MKRLSPENLSESKVPSLDQLNLTIEGMESDYSRLQQQLFNYTDKIN